VVLPFGLVGSPQQRATRTPRPDPRALAAVDCSVWRMLDVGMLDQRRCVTQKSIIQ
jgi:hypothetical protein